MRMIKNSDCLTGGDCVILSSPPPDDDEMSLWLVKMMLIMTIMCEVMMRRHYDVSYSYVS